MCLAVETSAKKWLKPELNIVFQCFSHFELSLLCNTWSRARAQPSCHFVRRIALLLAPCSVWYIARATLLSLCACWIARGAMLILILLARPSHHFVLVVLSRCGAGLIWHLSRDPPVTMCMLVRSRCGALCAVLHRCCYAIAFTHRKPLHAGFFCAPALLHKNFYTQELLHTEALTHRCLWTLLHSGAFTDTLRTGAVALQEGV